MEIVRQRCKSIAVPGWVTRESVWKSIVVQTNENPSWRKKQLIYKIGTKKRPGGSAVNGFRHVLHTQKVTRLPRKRRLFRSRERFFSRPRTRRRTRYRDVVRTKGFRHVCLLLLPPTKPPTPHRRECIYSIPFGRHLWSFHTRPLPVSSQTPRKTRRRWARDKTPGPVCVFACELIEDSVNYRRVFFFFIISRALPSCDVNARATGRRVTTRSVPRRNEFIRFRGYGAVLRSLTFLPPPFSGLISRPKPSSAKTDVLNNKPPFFLHFRRFFCVSQ